MNQTATPSEVEAIAAKVKKAAIFRKVMEDYGLGGEQRAPEDVDRIDLSNPPEDVTRTTGGPQEPDPVRAGINVRTPGGWAAYKASFDWIEERFTMYTKRGDVAQFTPAGSSLHQARKALQLRGPKGEGRSDPLDGQKGSILDELHSGELDNGVFAKQGWTGKTSEAFKLYIEGMEVRECNIVNSLGSLWQALDADSRILSQSYGWLHGIGKATVNALVNDGFNDNDGDGGGYNADSKVTFQIIGAVVGITVAVMAATMTAGAAAPAIAGVVGAVVQGGIGIGGEWASDDKTNAKKGESAPGGKPINITGSDTDSILGAMIQEIYTMHQDMESAVGEVEKSLDQTYHAVGSAIAGGAQSVYAGQHPLVGPRPKISDSGRL